MSSAGRRGRGSGTIKGSGFRPRRLALATAWVLLLAGCGGAPGTAPATATAPAASRGASSTESPSTGTTSARFANPVYESDFPDPMIVRDGSRYLAVATNGNGSNVQVATSPDLVRWEQAADALPRLPAWTSPGKVWAPEIAVHSRTRSVLYYTTPAPGGRRQCIGVAVAKQPEGPYVDSSRGPLVCDSVQLGGSIDPHPFVDVDGKRYLYWKNDGNAVRASTYLWVQRLSPDGARLQGKPRRLIKQDQPWEGSLIEAPFVLRRGSTYHLFYSANDYGSWSYAEGHATAEAATGPFVKDPDPVLASNDVAAGPGGGAIVVDEDRVWMAFHAWQPDGIGDVVTGRQLWLSEVRFEGDKVTVEPPEALNADPPDPAG